MNTTTAFGDGLNLFHTPNREPYATIDVNSHFETHALASKAFRQLLERRYYALNGSMPSEKTIKNALREMEGAALFDGPTLPVHLRVAGVEDTVYLDLGDERWQAIAITADNWLRVEEQPVKFRRPPAMAPLPFPEPGGSLEELRPFVNLGSEDDWRLLVSFLVNTFRPRGPYPVLVLTGQQGSAKSTLTRIIRALTDPNYTPICSMARSERDLCVNAQHHWLLAFDNVSSLSHQMSDALCRLATGSGFAARKLFTDAEEVALTAQRSVILNGIEDFVTRDDLLDRSITLQLPTLSDVQRRDERQFWLEFEQARPRILGALLEAVKQALRDHDTIAIPELPRMADFAVWSCAAAPACGSTPEEFLEAYTHNRQAANDLALDASPVAQAVLKLVEQQGSWQGTATQLLTALTPYLEGVSGADRPRSAQSLSNALRRLKPNLSNAGVDCTFGRKPGGKRDRLITLREAQGKTTEGDPLTTSLIEMFHKTCSFYQNGDVVN
jgi:hypothetical protein